MTSLTWKKLHDSEGWPYLQSDCGRFTVAKVNLSGIFFYEAWRNNPTANIAVRVNSPDVAKQVCEDFVRENP